ncbi:hypothetical protein [Streptomyces sp. NPDC056723]|uniref:hypothetical protein n=1 Tax=Streptomyces sp. NPDC056723 TaxID=3345925 RepID=UPI0036AB326C
MPVGRQGRFGVKGAEAVPDVVGEDVLRPGGRILVAEYRPPRGRFARHSASLLLGHTMAHLKGDMVETLLREAEFEALSGNDLRPAMCCTFGVKPAQEAESL